jgi:hypothetical protein
MTLNVIGFAARSPRAASAGGSCAIDAMHADGQAGLVVAHALAVDRLAAAQRRA